MFVRWGKKTLWTNKQGISRSSTTSGNTIDKFIPIFGYGKGGWSSRLIAVVLAHPASGIDTFQSSIGVSGASTKLDLDSVGCALLKISHPMEPDVYKSTLMKFYICT